MTLLYLFSQKPGNLKQKAYTVECLVILDLLILAVVLL
jgi:hypothetical protein